MRRVSPLTIELLLHIYARGDEIPHRWAPAQQEIICRFLDDGLIMHGGICDHHLQLTTKGHVWLERVLTTLPPRGYGSKAEGFYIIGKDEPAFAKIEFARIEAMQKIDGRYAGFQEWYGQGAYILRAIELIEPITPAFKTTHLC